MSHFTKLDKANIVSPDAFIAAMKELGMTEVERNTEVRAWDGNDKPVKVDVFCRFPGKRSTQAYSMNAANYGIGLQAVGNGKYAMISDWSLTGNSLPQEIRKTLPDGFPAKDGPGQRAFAACEALRGMALGLTTKHTLVQQYRRQGFRVSVKQNADRTINIQLTR